MEKSISVNWNKEIKNIELKNDLADEYLINGEVLELDNTDLNSIVITFEGEIIKNGGACLYLNNYAIPLNSKVVMEITPPVKLNFVIKIPGDSGVKISNLEIIAKDIKENLYEECNNDADVLVVTPDYPSTENLYLAAFVHSRVREYVNQGLNVQVAVINNSWYEKKYTFEDIDVYVGSYFALKKLLSRKQYKVIITHFVDTPLFQIYDGYITDERLIFICHGPETTFRRLNNVCRPYFTSPVVHEDVSEAFDLKEKWVRKFAQKDNVDWVFVSEFLMNFGEECCGCTFKNKHIIHNIINEQLFPYKEKTQEDRKHIVILRKFDNVSVHAIDESVFTILELSKRPFFSDLTFEVYGDGTYWKELVEPLKQFDNVKINKTFIPNKDIHLIYEKNGIALMPSRHDAHPVSMGEAASCGLVVIGSKVTSVPYFMGNEINHTCADPENFHQLADIIERLYYNPDEYLRISNNMASFVREKCNINETVGKEVSLIQEKIKDTKLKLKYIDEKQELDQPLLSIVVPAYNVEEHILKCLYSLCNHRNVNKTEVLVINDGSKDRTSEISHDFAKLTNGIVKVIDKENSGHGSTINTGIKEAKGKYFRLIDGDDWVDGENLAKQVDLLEKQEVDIMLTKGCYEYVDKPLLENIIDYPMLREGVIYNFDDLLYKNYGFETYGPVLSTATYRTECLKKTNMHIAEKKPYVDMEFNAYSQRYTKTLVYYDLDIYRYLIGREGQTVSVDFWKKKYNDHRFIIFDILNTMDSFDDYSEWRKKEYVYKHLLAMMIDSQIFMYDQLMLWPEIDMLFKDLSKWPDCLNAAKEYIIEKNGDCKVILDNYKKAIDVSLSKPIISEGIKTIKKKNVPVSKMLKKTIKAILPYGVIRIYQKRKYNM